MLGYEIASEHHSTFVVAALDMGCFPQVFSTWIFDQFAYAELVLEISNISKKANYRLSNYQPTDLVYREGDSLIWTPDPEWNYYGYRAERYVKFTPITDGIEHDGKKYYGVVLIEWETGHKEESGFISSVVGMCEYCRCYSNDFSRILRENKEKIISHVKEKLTISNQN